MNRVLRRNLYSLSSSRIRKYNKINAVEMVKSARLTIKQNTFSSRLQNTSLSGCRGSPSAPRKITFSRGPRNILIRPFPTLRASSDAVAADVLTKVPSPRHTLPLSRSLLYSSLIFFFLCPVSRNVMHRAMA